MKKARLDCLVSRTAFAVLLFALPFCAAARTDIPDGYIFPPGETHFIPSGSPYVLLGTATVNIGSKLIVEEGVILKIGRVSGLQVLGGSLEMRGAGDNPIFVTSRWDDTKGGDTSDGTQPPLRVHRGGIVARDALENLVLEHVQLSTIPYGLSLFNSTIHISDSSFTTHDSMALYAEWSTTTIDRTSFTGNPSAVYVVGGALSVTDGVFEDNWNSGIFAQYLPVFVERSFFRNPRATGIGINNVSFHNQRSVIKDSSFVDHFYYGVGADGDPSLVDARNNWWGDPSGPREPGLNPSGVGDSVLNVLFDPWLSAPPDSKPPPPEYEECCSSVLFIPGLMASRLYRPGVLFEDKLWEPNNQNDVRQLALSPTTGESVDPFIYTRDVLDEPLGVGVTGNVYKGFLAFMNDLVVDGTINDFESLPYDWRLDVRDVVSRPVLIEAGAYSMMDKIEELAGSSQTGKVTLITHSNGGLVAKELINQLVREGNAGLVDQVIMVAAPELGTPDAIMALLHGADFFLGLPNHEVTRELGENMKSAYALLPSREYFDRVDTVSEPIIKFDPLSEVTAPFRAMYGTTISTYDDVRKFILGDNGVRPEPAASDVGEPNVLKEHFLENAEAHHESLDVWTLPAGVKVIEIVGWGLATPYGIEYKSTTKRVCNQNNSVCLKQEFIDPEPMLTYEGDETVVYPSAEALGGERYYVRLDKYNQSLLGLTINRSHKNILEIEPLQRLVEVLISRNATSTLPSFILPIKPIKTDEDKNIELAVHSPVTLHLYDSQGRHTGPIPNPDPTSDLSLIEEQIPNSYYWQIGEGQYAGADGSATTTVKLDGLTLGTFTLEVTALSGGEIETKTVFEDIPVATSTIATLAVGVDVEPVIALDIDGDGVTDSEISEGGLNAEELIGIVKGLVKTLNVGEVKEKRLLNRLTKLEKELAKEHKREKVEKMRTKFAFSFVENLISRYEKRKILSKDEAAELLSIINDIKNMVVE